MQATVNKRVFMHNGSRLTDPDKVMSPAAVKDLFSTMYPELLNAEIKGPDVSGDELIYTFHRTTGTKGATARRTRPAAVKAKLATHFVRRLDIAAGETSTPTSALPASKLNALRIAMTPALGSPVSALPSMSFALLL